MATKIRASNLHTDVKTMVTTMVGENALDSAEANLLIDAKFTANSTDVLSEGSTNLYFTNARADARADTRAQLKIDALVDAAPGSLDTLNELAAALGDDANFSTTITNSVAAKLPLAGGTMTGNINFGDNDKAIFGAGSDLQIYHDGSNSYIKDADTGNLYLEASAILVRKAGTSENIAKFVQDDRVELYYDNASKLTTTSTGIDVTGDYVNSGHLLHNNNSGLKIIGGGNATNAGSNLTLYGGSNSSAGTFRFRNGTATHLEVAGNGDISFYEDTGVTAKFFWDASAEKLGIGTTPNNKLTLSDGSTSYTGHGGGTYLEVVRGSGADAGIILNKDTGQWMMGIDNSDGTNPPLRFEYSAGGSAHAGLGNGTVGLTLNYQGKVGIGTSSPNRNVEVSSLYNTTLRLASTRNTNSWTVGDVIGQVEMYSADGTAPTASVRASVAAVVEDASGASTGLAFRTYNNTERMRIDSSGKVGIGESSPLGKLHIKNGDSGATVDVGADELVVESNTNSGITILSGQSYSGSIYFGDAGVNYDGFVTYGQSTRSMAFGTAAGTRMTLDSSGNVGIGATTPTAKLHVEGTFQVRSSSSSIFNDTNNVENVRMLVSGTHFNADGADKDFQVSSDNLSHALFVQGSDGNVGMGIAPYPNTKLTLGGTDSVGYPSVLMFDNNNSSGAEFFMLATDTNWTAGANKFVMGHGAPGSGNVDVTIDSSGQVGMGTYNPTEKLHVSGNILATGNVTAYSDISLKDNITAIPDALDKVLQIRGVTYNRNDIEDNPRHTGVIAQEVEKVLPEVISENEDGIKSVAYGNMVGLLIEAIKELKAEIEELKGK